jgi:hypothetical protein
MTYVLFTPFWGYCKQSELGTRYFFLYSISDIPILQCLYSISILRYFSEFCNTIPDIRYRYFFPQVASEASPVMRIQIQDRGSDTYFLRPGSGIRDPFFGSWRLSHIIFRTLFSLFCLAKLKNK